MGKSFLSLRFVATALLTLGLLTVGGLNIQQKRIYVIPEDGCSWIQTAAGVQARAVVKGGPCQAAGVEEGDFLREINGRPSRPTGCHKDLYELRPVSTAIYKLSRNGSDSIPRQLSLVHLSNAIVRQRLYLEIIGIYSFVVGAFVLIKRFRAPHVLHFYFVCLISFVLFAYSYTGKLERFRLDRFLAGYSSECFPASTVPAFLP